MHMRDGRLRVTHLCRVLTQRFVGKSKGALCSWSGAEVYLHVVLSLVRYTHLPESFLALTLSSYWFDLLPVSSPVLNYLTFDVQYC